MTADLERELEQIKTAYQQSVNELKHELSICTGKYSVLMQTVNTMADAVARRNLIIERLCEHLEKAGETETAKKAKEGLEL